MWSNGIAAICCFRRRSTWLPILNASWLVDDSMQLSGGFGFHTRGGLNVVNPQCYSLENLAEVKHHTLFLLLYVERSRPSTEPV